MNSQEVLANAIQREKDTKYIKYQKSNYLFEDDGLAEDNKLSTENLFFKKNYF